VHNTIKSQQKALRFCNGWILDQRKRSQTINGLCHKIGQTINKILFALSIQGRWHFVRELFAKQGISKQANIVVESILNIH
jgi:hypothetical protein